MRIGDAAAAAGTTPRALRFYEQQGLLPRPGAPPPGNATTAPRRSPAYASFANSSPSA